MLSDEGGGGVEEGFYVRGADAGAGGYGGDDEVEGGAKGAPFGGVAVLAWSEWRVRGGWVR